LLKKPPSKADLQQEIDRQIESYLGGGSSVQQIPRGVSSHEGGEKLPPARWQMEKSKGDRTYLPQLVDSLERRRREKPPATPTKQRKRPRKRLIYDDFGEPLRWVWVDE